MDVQGTMTISIQDFNKIVDKIDNKSKQIEVLLLKEKDNNIALKSKCPKLAKYDEILTVLATYKPSKLSNIVVGNNENIIIKIKNIVENG